MAHNDPGSQGGHRHVTTSEQLLHLAAAAQMGGQVVRVVAEAARKTFPWDYPERWDLDALAFHKTIIALRRSHPALQAGDYAPLYADPDVYAFARTLEGSMLIAAVNVAEDARRFEIPLAGSLTAQPATPTISCSRQAAHPPPS